MPTHPILIAGQWRSAQSEGTFHAENPATGQALAGEYPISTWADIDAALNAATEAAIALRSIPGEKIGKFLSRYAERIESRAADLVAIANEETALPKSPRLLEIELPRTTGQLRQAAAAATEGSWAMATIDSKTNIRSYLAPIGPVCVFGPNNFPFAFNGIAGGDFAAAIAAGNPVIAKGHPSHPGTTRLLAEEALGAIGDAGLPLATVQLIYHMSPESGLKLVADPRVGATAFTGSRFAGLKLKAAADAAGKPIYVELSSLNPVVILPGALNERLAKIADEFADSCLAATGQFCTNPGIVLLTAGSETEEFIAAVKQRFETRPAGTLLSAGVAKSLAGSIATLEKAGAKIVTGGKPVSGAVNKFANTLFRVEASYFLEHPEKLQTEAFGNASLFILARDAAEKIAVLEKLEGNLTGCIYSDTRGGDDAIYEQIAPALRPRVGRLLNDKMPTGVAVSPAMNHGGPFPSTGHPGFTAVGIPASLRRFAMLQCFDNVRANRLPALLANKNPDGRAWRSIDGSWTKADL
jgi:NADP-dependent aldehyde dehydrogenase